MTRARGATGSRLRGRTSFTAATGPARADSLADAPRLSHQPEPVELCPKRWSAPRGDQASSPRGRDAEESSEGVDKPDSVPAPNGSGLRSFLWAGRYRPARATYPRVGAGHATLLLVLLRVGFAERTRLRGRWWDTHRFTDSSRPQPRGRLLSVALSPDHSGPSLTATLPCGVRTFLPPRACRDERPPDPLRTLIESATPPTRRPQAARSRCDGSWDRAARHAPSTAR